MQMRAQKVVRRQASTRTYWVTCVKFVIHNTMLSLAALAVAEDLAAVRVMLLLLLLLQLLLLLLPTRWCCCEQRESRRQYDDHR
jgi:hypothetical protein